MLVRVCGTNGFLFMPAAIHASAARFRDVRQLHKANACHMPVHLDFYIGFLKAHQVQMLTIYKHAVAQQHRNAVLRDIPTRCNNLA